jgi:hypothetical protein
LLKLLTSNKKALPLFYQSHTIKSNTMTVTAKSTMLVGSFKSGYIQINKGEQVLVSKETKNSYYITKNGITKMISKKQFM